MTMAGRDCERHALQRSTDGRLGCIEIAMRIQPDDAGIVQRRERPKARIAVPREHDDRSIVSRHGLAKLSINARHPAGPLQNNARPLEPFENYQGTTPHLDRSKPQVIRDGDHRQTLFNKTRNSPAMARHALAPVKLTSANHWPR